MAGGERGRAVLIAVGTAVALFALFYLLAAFAQWDANAAHWPISAGLVARALYRGRL